MANIIQKFMACKTRWDFGRMDKRRDAGQSIPDDVMRFENILYGPDKKFQKWQYLDVYRPAGKSQKEKLGDIRKGAPLFDASVLLSNHKKGASPWTPLGFGL